MKEEMKQNEQKQEGEQDAQQKNHDGQVDNQSTKQSENQPAKTVEQLQAELVRSRNLVGEMINLSKKVQADFENYRKRVDRDKVDFIKAASENIISDLLPIVDNFELALKNKDNAKEFVKGVELIYQDMMKLLENQGVKKIVAENEQFNPRFHEALLQEESDKDNVVLQEFQSGYTMNDKVLRHAKVKIGRSKK